MRNVIQLVIAIIFGIAVGLTAHATTAGPEAHLLYDDLANTMNPIP